MSTIELLLCTAECATWGHQAVPLLGDHLPPPPPEPSHLPEGKLSPLLADSPPPPPALALTAVPSVCEAGSSRDLVEVGPHRTCPADTLTSLSITSLRSIHTAASDPVSGPLSSGRRANILPCEETTCPFPTHLLIDTWVPPLSAVSAGVCRHLWETLLSALIGVTDPRVEPRVLWVIGPIPGTASFHEQTQEWNPGSCGSSGPSWGTASFHGLPRWRCGKEPACQCRRRKRPGFRPWVGKIPWRRKWQPNAVFLLGGSHGQRSLGGCGPWGRKESDTTATSCQCLASAWLCFGDGHPGGCKVGSQGGVCVRV